MSKLHFLIPVIWAFVAAGLLAWYFATSSGGYDASGNMIGRDFVNTHLGGVLAWDGKLDIVFDVEGDGRRYYREVQALHGEAYPLHNWSYPPLLLPVSQFLALFPYFWAYALWTAVGIGLVFAAVRALELPLIWGALICLSPAGFLNIIAGQNGFYTGGLMMMAIVATLGARPVRAGFCWAILAAKPHLGVCVVPFLLLGRHVRVIVWGGLFLAVAIAGTLVAYGPGVWHDFLSFTTRQQVIVAEIWDGLLLVIIPSAFMQGRLWDLDLSLAYWLHFAVAALTIALLYLRWPGRRGDVRVWALWIVTGTLLILPYSFLYDMVAYQFAIALWAARPDDLLGRTGPPVLRGILMAVLWLLPIVSPLIALSSTVQIVPIVLLFVLAWAPGMRRAGGKPVDLLAKAH